MMDRRVKERLVGATILVALIVLVVPELLSGPKPSAIPPLAQGLPDSTRTVSVDLATSKQTAEPQAADGAATGGAAAASPPQASSGSEAGRSDTSATDAPAAAVPSAPSVTTLRAQESASPSLETPPPSPRSPDAAARSAPAPNAGAALSGRHAWAVQLGSFASKANAERLVHQLQASAGSPVYVVSSGSGASARYRVRVGPLSDRGAAERAVQRLKAQGHAATIVTPTSG
jgi:DedD protein